MDWANLFTLTWQTLAMTIISSICSYIIALPIGILLNVTSKKGLCPNRPLNLIIGLIVNILRSIPCLVLVVLCMPATRKIFGVGTGEWYTILLPLIVSAFGFVARMVEQSLNEVPAGEIEAIKSLGASNFQIIMKVLLPEARSSLISGFAVSSVSILTYTSFAYNIGAGGLISGIWSYYTRHTGNYLESATFWILIIVVIILVQIIQESGLFIAKKIDKRRILK